MLENLPRTIEWLPATADAPEAVRLIDQRKLPHDLEYMDCTCSKQVCDAIAQLAVRGAPAIGDSGAYAVALWARDEWPVSALHAGIDAKDANLFMVALKSRAAEIAAVRPTAVNLSWAVDEVMKAAQEAAIKTADVAAIGQAILQHAHQITQEDEKSCEAIGKTGAAEFARLAKELGRPLRVETHCNAGSLACAFYGTATSVIYHAFEAGDIEMVWVDETRPVDQGARLTAWEMGMAGIPYKLICDNMAGSLMQAGQVDAVVVGADRVCANGDFANKIGTYPLAVLAKHHGVPFYTAVPSTTFDMTLQSGDQIVIEQRNPMEVRCAPIAGGQWQAIAPQDCDVYNPAFDVTPHELLSGIITEDSVIRY